MPKTIPGVLLRDIVADDVDRVIFLYSKDDQDNDVVTSIVGYDWVEAVTEEKYEDRRYDTIVPDGTLKTQLLALREDTIVPVLLNADGYS
jgi:hypothetical protein